MMNAWDLYEERLNGKGGTMRGAVLRREKRVLSTKLPKGLSYHNVTLNGKNQSIEIIDTDNFNIKLIYSMPNEDIPHGSLIEWFDNYWLTVEKDANSELRAKAKMKQCNYLLKWINADGEICEQQCIVEDGTKYMVGEAEGKDNIMARGDTRIAVTLPKNDKTVKLGRNMRFLIDDPESDVQMAYVLTKPIKVGQVYNDSGVFVFILQETQTTDNDNKELGIADYYKHFDKNGDIKEDVDYDSDDTGKKVWF